MPLMEVILQQRYLGQQIINRWNYLSSGTPAAVTHSFALASAFGAIPDAGVYPTTAIIARIRQLQDSGVTFENILVRDVYSVTDFYQTPFSPALAGAVTGAGIGPISAFGFVSSKTRYDIRRGTKRFVGITSGQVTVDNGFNSTVISELAALAGNMSETLEYDDEGNALAYEPVIVGREKVLISTPPAEPRYSYRYYDTFAEQADHLMDSITWSAYTGVRSQVSRQIGRGS